MHLGALFGGRDEQERRESAAAAKIVLDDWIFARPPRWQVRQLFAHFHNLNLRVLIEDLRRGWISRTNWYFAGDLCPVAHGLPDGHTVRVLCYVSQAVDLPGACRRAAEELGVAPRLIEDFVLGWDGGGMSVPWLVEQLDTIWQERQADADAVQCVLAPVTPSANWQ